MKANNLSGEYCMSCAGILDDVQRNHRRVIVLDSQCAAVFHQSGDAARLDSQAKQADEAPPVQVHKAEVQTVHVKPAARVKVAKRK